MFQLVLNEIIKKEEWPDLHWNKGKAALRERPHLAKPPTWGRKRPKPQLQTKVDVNVVLWGGDPPQAGYVIM